MKTVHPQDAKSVLKAFDTLIGYYHSAKSADPNYLKQLADAREEHKTDNNL